MLSVSLLLSVSDEQFNFISSKVLDDLQSKYFSNIQLPSSKLQRKFYFDWSNLLREEKSFHILT